MYHKYNVIEILYIFFHFEVMLEVEIFMKMWKEIRQILAPPGKFVERFLVYCV